MATKEKTNFECLILDETGKACGDVRESKQGITAHIVHGTKHGHGKRAKGFKLQPDMWKMSSKKAIPSKYNPEWGKGTLGRAGRKPKDAETETVPPERTKRKYVRKAPLPSQLVGQGTMHVPVLLEIDFSFQIPRISQANVETQVIKVGTKKKK